MKVKISDMMAHIEDDSVTLRTDNTASLANIKEATMKKIHGDNTGHKTPRRLSRTLLIAAVVAAALSISALAVWRLSLKELEAQNGSLSMAGLRGTAQYAASEEWEGYVQDWFDKGENMAEPGSETDEYFDYCALSEEAKAELDSLLDRYDLKMHETPVYAYTLEELYALTGRSGFMPAGAQSGEYPVGGRFYPDGTFFFNGDLDVPDAGGVAYQFYSCNKDYFTRGLSLLSERLENPVEWTYTTSEGVAVLLALGSYTSVMAADMDDCFVFVNILSGRDNDRQGGSDAATAAYGAPILDRAALEALAESFDLTAINDLSA